MTKEINLPESFREITTSNKLFCQFDEENGVLLLDVKNAFTAEDFIEIENIINPFFEAKGELGGVIINSKKFPYWQDSKNRSEYFHFAQNNHYKFKKAAFSMGGFFIKIVARFARNRAHPQIKTFKYGQIEQAQEWVLGN